MNAADSRTNMSIAIATIAIPRMVSLSLYVYFRRGIIHTVTLKLQMNYSNCFWQGLALALDLRIAHDRFGKSSEVALTLIFMDTYITLMISR
jgi:hypothetical protein